MGLDMYLTAKKYISSYGDKGKLEQEKYAAHFPTFGFALCDITLIVCTWRKANQIHKWFVDNVQGGEDNCVEVDVSYDDLMDLAKRCEKVLADHSLAPTLLPTTSGFFFGSTDYGEYYFEQLQHTLDALTNVFANKEALVNNDYFLLYRSSW